MAGSLVGASLIGVVVVPGVGAIPRLDLAAYPAPVAGESRWVIQLPGLLPPTRDPALSANPRDWRVQVIVGQMAKVDCNAQSFSGRLRVQPLPGNPVPGEPPLSVLRVSEVGPMVSTRMACPPGQPLRERFVVMAGKPFVMPYNVSRPIVVYAPQPLEVRWRLWKAESQQRSANAL
jgi:ecotin